MHNAARSFCVFLQSIISHSVQSLRSQATRRRERKARLKSNARLSCSRKGGRSVTCVSHATAATLETQISSLTCNHGLIACRRRLVDSSLASSAVDSTRARHGQHNTRQSTEESDAVLPAADAPAYLLLLILCCSIREEAAASSVRRKEGRQSIQPDSLFLSD